MTRKNKTLISVIAFVLIFGALLTVATFYDLEISKILTRNALAAHTYSTNETTFGVLFEIIGCDAVYFLIAFAVHILFWYGVRVKKGTAGIILAFAATATAVGDYYVLASDTFGYIKTHLTISSGASLDKGMFLNATYAFFAVLFTFLGTMAARNFTEEQTRKLFRFAVAALILSAVPSLLINEVIKEPVGRIRFRAMNLNPDDPTYGFAAFARWYEVNGQWIDDETKREIFGTTDALKSFPSGHTAGAGMSYGVIMLIDALGIKNKKAKAALWICPVVFTGCVAVARIIVGAHFMSDVLVGGTMSFVTMIIVREILICRGANVKALFGKEQ